MQYLHIFRHNSALTLLEKYRKTYLEHFLQSFFIWIQIRLEIKPRGNRADQMEVILFDDHSHIDDFLAFANQLQRINRIQGYTKCKAEAHQSMTCQRLNHNRWQQEFFRLRNSSRKSSEFHGVLPVEGSAGTVPSPVSAPGEVSDTREAHREVCEREKGRWA